MKNKRKIIFFPLIEEKFIVEIKISLLSFHFGFFFFYNKLMNYFVLYFHF